MKQDGLQMAFKSSIEEHTNLFHFLMQKINNQKIHTIAKDQNSVSTVVK